MRTGKGQPHPAIDVHQAISTYRNLRPDYRKAFWALVNWKFAARNYKN